MPRYCRVCGFAIGLEYGEFASYGAKSVVATRESYEDFLCKYCFLKIKVED